MFTAQDASFWKVERGASGTASLEQRRWGPEAAKPRHSKHKDRRENDNDGNITGRIMSLQRAVWSPNM